jgi:hypothetical protein
MGTGGSARGLYHPLAGRATDPFLPTSLLSSKRSPKSATVIASDTRTAFYGLPTFGLPGRTAPVWPRHADFAESLLPSHFAVVAAGP